MLKERIKEVFEFTKSESPYKKANKGWINQDIFLDLTPSPDSVKQKNEAARVTLLFSPINSLLSNIFLILILGSILVFTSVSFAKGRFNFNFFNNSLNREIVQTQDNNDSATSSLKDLNSTNLKTDQNIDKTDIDKPSNINSLDNNQINSDEKKINEQTEKPEIKEIKLKDIEPNKDIKNLQNKKSKSNFI